MEHYFKDNDGQNEKYQQQKLTHEEIRQFQQFSEMSDKEIENISDLIYEFAIVALKVID
jgi:hypothetical protein